MTCFYLQRQSPGQISGFNLKKIQFWARKNSLFKPAGHISGTSPASAHHFVWKEISAFSFNTTVMHLAKNIRLQLNVAADIQARCVRLQFLQILLSFSFHPGSIVMCCDFYRRDTTPSSQSLEWAACCSCKSICVYLPLWCSSSLKQVCFLSVSLYSRYLWMWVWPLKGFFLNSVSWSSALLCSDVALLSLFTFQH